MKQLDFSPIILTLFVLVVSFIVLPHTAQAQKFERFESSTFYLTVRAGACDVMNPSVGVIVPSTPLDALVYGAPPARPCNPVTAPDGHHMTLGEFNAIEGSVRVQCLRKGTLVSIRLSGLQPFGIYTVWVPINVAPPPTSSTALGSVVGDEKFVNSFRANVNGTAEITRIQPEGVGTNIPGYTPPCLLGDPDNRVEVHIVYHLDGLTNGPMPGPPTTWVVEERFQLFLP
jgi:hypothetical protein